MTRASYEDQKVTNQTLVPAKRTQRDGGSDVVSIDSLRGTAPVRPQSDYSVAAPRGVQTDAPDGAANFAEPPREPHNPIDRAPVGKPSVRDSVVSKPRDHATTIDGGGHEDKLASSTRWLLKRGHGLTFLGLFLFTAVLYFRPYELIPALSFLSSFAFWIALATLLIFIPTQLGLEGNLTARPREINLILLLTLTALLSIPFGTDRGTAWEEFSGSFIKVIIMFIVMVNVVRTEARLKTLILLSFAVSCYLSFHALKDYQSLVLNSFTDRIWGVIGGPFGNPNDLALHLATMVPLALALSFGTRNMLLKPLYLACMLLMVGGIVVTFSRGGFLGLVTAMMVFGWKAGRNNRFLVIVGGVLLLVAFLAVAPGSFMGRLASVYDQSQDTGSVGSRSALFWQSLYVTAANPVLGIGMGNFSILGIRSQVSHNAYTQVSAEMGLAALVIYCLFIVAPFKRLLRIERATIARETPSARRLHFLAVGLQASLAAYAVSSFFGSVAYIWYVYYIVGYALCLDRLYAAYAANTPETPLAVESSGSLRPGTGESDHRFQGRQVSTFAARLGASS